MKRLIKYGLFSFITFIVFSFFGLALADPPTRVARLSAFDGAVSFLPVGTSDWVYAKRNRPFTTGDRLWTNANTRAELQLGVATLHAGSTTDLNLLNLSDRVVQLQLNQGSINLRVWKIDPDQVYEIDTPNLAFSVNQVGDYRIDVNSNNTTSVTVRRGQAAVYGEATSYLLNRQQSYLFSGTNLNIIQRNILAMDSLDKWSDALNARRQSALSRYYVSEQVIGYEDLDVYGQWDNDPDYGYIWQPNHISPNWVPYREGRWIWVNAWGWTWVDDAPWGFAPFHYGRWAHSPRHRGWVWIPGPVYVQPVYAPALVAFFGSGNFQISISMGHAIQGVGWFPLGPGDVYRPPYTVSETYFKNINMSNTIVNQHELKTLYSDPHKMINYRNFKVQNALTVTPLSVFTDAQEVKKNVLPLNKALISQDQVKPMVSLAPTLRSLTGGVSSPESLKPPKAVSVRPAIVKLTPPAPAVLDIMQGKPLEPLKPVRAPSFIKLNTIAKPMTPPEGVEPLVMKPSLITQPSSPIPLSTVPHPIVTEPTVIRLPEHAERPMDIRPPMEPNRPQPFREPANRPFVVKPLENRPPIISVPTPPQNRPLLRQEERPAEKIRPVEPRTEPFIIQAPKPIEQRIERVEKIEKIERMQRMPSTITLPPAPFRLQPNTPMQPNKQEEKPVNPMMMPSNTTTTTTVIQTTQQPAKDEDKHGR